MNDSKEHEHVYGFRALTVDKNDVYQGVKLNYQSKENDKISSVRNEPILRTNLEECQKN
jgi:hypothetical protein